MMEVFSIAQEHAPIDGLTISSQCPVKTENNHIVYFSLGAGTDISQEMYPSMQMYICNGGKGTFLVAEKKVDVKDGDLVVVAGGSLCGAMSETGLVYTEVIPGKECKMNKIVKAGEVLQLKGLVPYQKDSIVNADIASNDTMKFVVMAFDEGTELTPHAAPGDAIVFALEGKATIGYEGKEYAIEAGQQFRFAKGGMHAVKANGKFKMALLLVLQ